MPSPAAPPRAAPAPAAPPAPPAPPVSAAPPAHPAPRVPLPAAPSVPAPPAAPSVPAPPSPPPPPPPRSPALLFISPPLNHNGCANRLLCWVVSENFCICPSSIVLSVALSHFRSLRACVLSNLTLRSHRRDCHFTDIPSPVLFKHLLKGEGGAAQ